MRKLFLITLTMVLSMASALAQHSNWGIKYKGELNIGYAIGGNLIIDYGSIKSDVSNIFIETTHGISITKYAFIGVGVGAKYYYGAFSKEYDLDSYILKDQKWSTLTIPAFVNIKGLYPINNSIAPFASFSIGRAFVLSSGINRTIKIQESGVTATAKEQLNGGLLCDAGAGVKISKFSIGLGWQYQQFTDNTIVNATDGTETAGISKIYDLHFSTFYIKCGVCF